MASTSRCFEDAIVFMEAFVTRCGMFYDLGDAVAGDVKGLVICSNGFWYVISPFPFCFPNVIDRISEGIRNGNG